MTTDWLIEQLKENGYYVEIYKNLLKIGSPGGDLFAVVDTKERWVLSTNFPDFVEVLDKRRKDVLLQMLTKYANTPTHERV